MEETGLRLAYLTSRYPALSATFITSEVHGLRRRGHTIGVHAVRRPALDRLPPEVQAEAAGVDYLLPARAADVLGSHAWALCRAPRRYLATLGLALGQPGGVRDRLHQLCYFAEAMLLARRLVPRRVRLLHVHHANHAASVGMLAGRYLGLPFSFTAHGSDILVEHHLLAEKLAAARFVVTVSEHNRARLEACRRGSTPPVHVVRTGVDLTRFRPPGARRHRPPPRLLAVGRLHPVKGFEHLVEAAATLRERGLDFTLSLVGDGPERARLAALIRRRGLEGQAWLAGPLGPDRLPEVYREADLFVLPSLSEGLPVVLMEAMASGLAVVATRITGIPELVEDGVSGRLVEPAQPAALAAALAALLADPARRRVMGEAGRAKVEREFDREVHLEALDRLFRRELGAPPRAGMRREASSGAGVP